MLILLHIQKVRFIITVFLCFADVINIMLVSLTNKAPFSAIFQIFGFLTQITKYYAIFVICTKNKTICGT